MSHLAVFGLGALVGGGIMFLVIIRALIKGFKR